MAYGMTLFGGGKVGKLILTFFRIFVSIFGIFYILEIIKRNQPVLLLVSLSMVLAGAIGNIIDSVFYGVVFSDINGYIASWFQGNVVDMFYAPLWEGALPEWLPFWGGQHFVFFAPTTIKLLSLQKVITSLWINNNNNDTNKYNGNNFSYSPLAGGGGFTSNYRPSSEMRNRGRGGWR